MFFSFWLEGLKRPQALFLGYVSFFSCQLIYFHIVSPYFIAQGQCPIFYLKTFLDIRIDENQMFPSLDTIPILSICY